MSETVARHFYKKLKYLGVNGHTIGDIVKKGKVTVPHPLYLEVEVNNVILRYRLINVYSVEKQV